jgi:PiT family inorganic phosphate transporter
MFLPVLIFAVLFVAYANGANDNFKGVATLFGSRSCSYRSAISWATLTTAAGSLAAIVLAKGLMTKFSGKGLVPDVLTTQPQFLLAVALATGATVLLATLLGFPISTTHGLTGALVGAGLIAAPTGISYNALGNNFVTPLLVSPLLALLGGGVLYALLARGARFLGISKGMCVCVGEEPQVLVGAGSWVAATAMTQVTMAAAEPEVCQVRYAGSRFLGVACEKIINGIHFLSAGAVCFARGLNDTPKIAALLLVATALDSRAGLLLAAVAMAVGGLLNAKKVGATMSEKITKMNTGQGLAANLATALLVNTASCHSLPVSTTHVSVGSLVGIGLVTRQTKWRPVLGILLSWVITLPCAALLAAVIYWLIRPR